jgi:hypothetical protein
MRGDIESGAREFSVFSRNLEAELATVIGSSPCVIGMSGCLDMPRAWPSRESPDLDRDRRPHAARVAAG